MKEDGKIYILDTSALLAYMEDEDGTEYIESLLIEAEKGEAVLHIAFISLTEVFYITAREQNESVALDRIKLIQSLAVQIHESYENLNTHAGRLKANNNISIADAYIAALCQEQNGILVHKDPEYEKLSLLIDEYRLPYKNK